MSPQRCFLECPPRVDITRLSGKLVVVEGPDSSGRSTHIALLTSWLEEQGHAVTGVGIKRSTLVAPELDAAKKGNVLSFRTMSLFYATDFADRLENEMVPALRAGYVVLTDRYVYSLIGRACVRGLCPEWMRKIYGFAVKPSAIYYLKISVADLIPRVLASGGFDYWESGADYLRGDMYDCFVKHQTALLDQFEQMSEEFGFTSVDASRSIEETFDTLQKHIAGVVGDIAPIKPSKLLVEEPCPPRRQRAAADSVSDLLRDFLSSLENDR